MKKHVLVVFVICVAIGLTGCSSLAQDGAMLRVHTAFEENDFSECLSRISRAENYGSQSRIMDAQIMFYKAMCLEGVGQIVASRGVFEGLVRLYPESDWAIVAESKLLNGENTGNSF